MLHPVVMLDPVAPPTMALPIQAIEFAMNLTMDVTILLALW